MAGRWRSTSRFHVRLDAAGKAKRTVDGRLFASEAEARRYEQLLLLQAGGAIAELDCQRPRLALLVNGVKLATYVPDFSYIENNVQIIEDVKGVRTDVYKLKKKLVKILYGIDIREVDAPKPPRRRKR